MARLVKRTEMDRSFDVEFWRRVGAEGRFAAMWQMIKDLEMMRGGDGREPRMDRSVVRVIRRRRKRCRAKT